MLAPDRGLDNSQPLLRVRNLVKTFEVERRLFAGLRRGTSGAVVRAVQDVSFSLHRGETLSLVGESGCGKSTIAKLVTRLYHPDRGEVLIDGTDVTRLSGRRALRPFGRRLQMIFQDPYASLNPRWSVADIIAEPIRAFGLATSSADISRRVGELLVQVGLDRGFREFPHEFSGGQRQRISIARALASKPELLICDEPTSALDVSVQAQILNLLKDLQQEFHLGILFISHNLAVVSHISHQIGVMYLGNLVEIGPAAQVFTKPRHPYTRLLIDTIPDLEMSGRARVPISGEVPNPIDPPSGCVFHPRCPIVRPRCSAEFPETIATDGGVLAACHAVADGNRDPSLPRPHGPVWEKLREGE